MISTLRAPRRAFTLLEIVLALAIGLLLLTGMYFALHIYLQTTQAGRQQIQQATVARAVIKKLASDINNNLTMMPPSAATSGSGTGSSSTSTNNNCPFVFNLGVQGDQDTLTLYISKVSLSNLQMATDGVQQQTVEPVDSDLRRITYWLVTDGKKTGLARQETKLPTSLDEFNNLPPAVSDPDSMVLAEEVVGVMFEYFDGTNWQSSWDGTVTVINASQPASPSGITSGGPAQSANGIIPPTPSQPWLGPPLAIRITLKIGRSDGKAVDPNDPNIMTLQQVIHIPAAVVGNQTASTTAMGNNASSSPTSGNGSSSTTGNSP